MPFRKCAQSALYIIKRDVCGSPRIYCSKTGGLISSCVCLLPVYMDIRNKKYPFHIFTESSCFFFFYYYYLNAGAICRLPHARAPRHTQPFTSSTQHNTAHSRFNCLCRHPKIIRRPTMTRQDEEKTFPRFAVYMCLFLSPQYNIMCLL